MPVYRVERPDQKARVVEAKTPAGARAHVAADEITVTKITTAEAMRLGNDGVKLETAGELPFGAGNEPEPEPEEPDPDRQREDKQERDRLDAENPLPDDD